MFKEGKEGSGRFKDVQRVPKVQEGKRKVPKGSIRFNMVQEALKWYTMALKVQ